MQPTIYVIDDDESMRIALEALLTSVGYHFKGFADPVDFLACTPIDSTGCLILDIRLPGVNGLTFQRRLTDANITLPIIFITGHGDIAMSVQAMKAGAVDFLPKPFRDYDLLDAVESALEINRKRLADGQGVAEAMEAYLTLSPREREIMAQIVSGKMNKQIAAIVGLSEMTVKVHRSHIMRKMQVNSLAELVTIAVKLKDAES